MEERGPGEGYEGSRAEWILKRANDFDAKARSFKCCRCGGSAVWVCLDPVCVTHNDSNVLCLCDECDQRFHPASHPVMCRHRRLAMVLYISLIMLYRYQRIVEFISATPANGTAGSSAGSLAFPDEVSSSTQPDVPPQPVTEVEVVSEKVIVESVASNVAPTTSTEDNATSSASVASGELTTLTSPTNRSQFLEDDLKSIHESYAVVLDLMRRDNSLSLADACRREPRGRLTVKNYPAIAELRLVDSEFYDDTVREFQRRPKGSGTLSGLERDCRSVLAAYSERVAAMRKGMELLPSACFSPS
ncbi:Hypp7090 [Branchiostoma lanceolatum]|uniref:Hypp7090 protein n=1 Tax=Branchiostoma lanceolatum TaxID=7740 RepID=A0A8J9YX24_BRALA|nr:Hypp7090 [Branchiostoma lanceolatum]